MAKDQVTEAPSSPAVSASRSDLSELERISAEMRGLIENGAASKNAAAAQKFDVGDRVTQLLEILKRAEVRATLTEDNRAFLGLVQDRLDDLLEGNQVSRGTLVNYGKIAKVFGPDHDIRKGSLPFSYAKTLSSLENENERDHWYTQALLGKTSVSRLQAELSSRRGPDSGITNRRKQSKVFKCAQTKQPITQEDLATMVVLQIPQEALQEDTKRIPRGKAASKSRSTSESSTSPITMRFRDFAAMALYAETHQQEYRHAASASPLSGTNAAEITPSNAADAAEPSVGTSDTPSVTIRSEDPAVD